MKKVFILSAVLLFLASCNVQTKLTNFYAKHCPESRVTKTTEGKFLVALKCDNLYDTAAISKYLDKGYIVYNFKSASADMEIVSSDSLPNIMAILKGVVKGIKK
jgi:hypothetical protein